MVDYARLVSLWELVQITSVAIKRVWKYPTLLYSLPQFRHSHFDHSSLDCIHWKNIFRRRIEKALVQSMYFYGLVITNVQYSSCSINWTLGKNELKIFLSMSGMRQVYCKVRIVSMKTWRVCPKKYKNAYKWNLKKIEMKSGMKI